MLEIERNIRFKFKLIYYILYNVYLIFDLELYLYGAYFRNLTKCRIPDNSENAPPYRVFDRNL